VCNLKPFIPRVPVHRPLLVPSIPRDTVSTTGGVIAKSVRGLTDRPADTMRITKDGVVAESVIPNPIPRIIYGNLRSGHRY
jgi:hypothetical protein